MSVVRADGGALVLRGFRDVNQMADFLGPDLFQGQAVSPMIRLAGLTLTLNSWAYVKPDEERQRMAEARRAIAECLAASGQK